MQDVLRPDTGFLSGGQECGVERDVADVASGNFKAGQGFVIQRSERGFGRKYSLPDHPAMAPVGERKFNQEAEPPQERAVQGRTAIGA